MAAKKSQKTGKPKGRPLQGAEPKVILTLRIEKPLLSQLNALIATTRRARSVEIEMAIEEHLAKAGLWPVTEPEGTAAE